MVVATLPISPYVSIHSCAIVCTKSGGGGGGGGGEGGEKLCLFSKHHNVLCNKLGPKIKSPIGAQRISKLGMSDTCTCNVKFAKSLRCVYKETITDTHTLTGLLSNLYWKRAYI